MDMSEYEVEITPEIVPQVTIETNMDELDSLVISDSTIFSYTISVDTGMLYFSELYVDKTIFSSSDTAVSNVWLHPGLVDTTGDHTITLLAYYKSLTGSLADNLNAEFRVADTAWTLPFLKSEQ
mgnify:CR=1 FL=1